MKKSILFLFLFLMGCASFKTNIVNYDNTNPVKIEEATQGLDITEILPSANKVNGTIALRSLEYEALMSNLDAGVVYMIEDNLIESLINNNYRVLERDPQGLSSLYQESTQQYRTYNNQYGESTNQDDVTVTINGETIIEQSTPGMSETANKFYENEFFDTSLEASDYILSYRVLECGVVYSDYTKDKAASITANPADLLKIERSARTRLHIRLTNSKTSEIISAGILENEVVDVIDKEDLEDLKQMSYNYYHHTLPLQYQLNQRGFNEDSRYAKANQKAKIEKGAKPQPAPKPSKAMAIIGGILAFLFLVNAD